MILFLPIFSGCKEEPDQYVLKIPEGFPAPDIPEDNPLTLEKAGLGERLFFDPRLSGDRSVSCASCHIPAFAFSDTAAVSRGFGGRAGERNSPSLVNIAYKPLMFRDGGVKRIETQVHGPIDNHFEMNISRRTLLKRLSSDSQYVSSFARVFGEAPSAEGMNYALAAYQRTLIFGNSRYDRYRLGEGSALTEDEKEGYRLFKSTDLKCSMCHSGVFFTDFSFQNNGMKEHYSDSGRAKVTMDPGDAGKFMVPSLRNVEVTAPYMHDGSLKTLDEVVEHYASGGSTHPVKSELIAGFELSDKKRRSLVAFLKTLTDDAFLPRDEKGNVRD